jgi:uncharacterized protein
VSRLLPLFPLGTLVFPGRSLDLHIFEPRYRLLISRCLADNTGFGIVLLQHGSETADGTDDSQPHTIGTAVTIDQHVSLPDGRFLIRVVGRQRFQILRLIDHQPYLTAEINDLSEITTGVAPLEQELRRSYQRYWRTMQRLGIEAPPELPPTAAADFSYWLADRLNISLARKQHWLELPLPARLIEMSAALRAELALLPAAGPLADQN